MSYLKCGLCNSYAGFTSTVYLACDFLWPYPRCCSVTFPARSAPPRGQPPCKIRSVLDAKNSTALVLLDWLPPSNFGLPWQFTKPIKHHLPQPRSIMVNWISHEIHKSKRSWNLGVSTSWSYFVVSEQYHPVAHSSPIANPINWSRQATPQKTAFRWKISRSGLVKPLMASAITFCGQKHWQEKDLSCNFDQFWICLMYSDLKETNKPSFENQNVPNLTT